MKKKQKAPGKRDIVAENLTASGTIYAGGPIKSGNTITINGSAFPGATDVITASTGQLTIGGAPSFPSIRLGIGTNAPSAETALHVQAAENNFGVLVDSLGVAASRIGLHAGSAKFASLAKNAFFITGTGWRKFDNTAGAFMQEVDPSGDVDFNVIGPTPDAAIPWTNAMRITPGGRIGMGTTTPNPQTTLHVQATQDNFGVLVDSGGVAGSRIGLHAGTAKFASLAKNAFFNAGTWNRFDTTSGAYLQEVTPAGNVTFNVAPSTGAAAITWKNALEIDSDGRMGIGGAPASIDYTSGPFRPHLTIHGDVRVTDVPVWNGPDENDLTWGAGFDGAIAFNPDRLLISREGSSVRYKEDIRPHDADFTKILAVESKVYRMREGYGAPGVENFGYIAEELHEAGLEDLVIYDRQGRPDGVKYKKVVLYVNEVVKAQQKMIEALQAEVAELKKARRPRARRKTSRKRAARVAMT
jgi:hypothetical protein